MIPEPSMQQALCNMRGIQSTRNSKYDDDDDAVAKRGRKFEKNGYDRRVLNEMRLKAAQKAATMVTDGHASSVESRTKYWYWSIALLPTTLFVMLPLLWRQANEEIDNGIPYRGPLDSLSSRYS